MARILVVDDQRDLLDALADYLVGLGHTVTSAPDGAEALEIVRRHAVDLVITDINMPDMDGIELLTSLHAENPDMPVIAMSGGGLFDKTVLLDSAYALGATLALPKPFELDELRLAVESVLGGEDR